MYVKIAGFSVAVSSDDRDMCGMAGPQNTVELVVGYCQLF